MKHVQAAEGFNAHEAARYYARSLRPEPPIRPPTRLDSLLGLLVFVAAVALFMVQRG
jgi:hypothetical protein